MTVTNWALNEVFTVRIYKRLTGRPDLLWANTYEINSDDVIGTGAENGRELSRRLALWESTFHLTDVEFDRAVFSTYVQDGVEYDPSDFLVEPLSGIVGTRPAGVSEPLALDACLFVRREVNFGRTGRLLYRRCLVETDVNAPAGTRRLVPASATALQALLDGDLPEPAPPMGIIEAMADISASLVMVLRDGVGSGEKRVITGFSAAGVTTKSTNNAFYNRRTPPVV